MLMYFIILFNVHFAPFAVFSRIDKIPSQNILPQNVLYENIKYLIYFKK